MTGFSFVDEIKRAKRAEQRLETRLAEERDERAFQKKRQIKADQRMDTLWDRDTAEYEDQLFEEKQREGYAKFKADNPNATAAQIAQYAPYNEQARFDLDVVQRRARQANAMETAVGIGFAGQPSNVAGDDTQDLAPGGPGLSNAVAGGVNPGRARGAADFQQPQVSNQVTPEQREAAGFNFGPDRSENNLVPVDIDDTSPYDPEYQQKTGLQKFGDRIAGGFAATQQFAGNFIDAAGARTPEQAAQARISGDDLRLPADRYTSPEKIDAMVEAGEMTTQEAGRIREQNAAVLQEYKEAGRKPKAFAWDAVSRQGALLEGSEQAVNAARAAGRAAVNRAEAFIDPAVESPLEQMADEDVRGAAAMYLNDRTTLKGANPHLAIEADKRAIPILDAAQEDMRAELRGLEPGTAQYRKTALALGNLQTSRDKIAAEHPGIADQAGGGRRRTEAR